jgi:hypothetical protein
VELIDAAVSYAARGWAVFPLFGVANARCRCGRRDCGRPGKHPLVARGLHEASTDAAVIATWWRRWPWANIGLATGARSGFVAIDVDEPHGRTSLRALQDQLGELPATLQALTGGGGLHLLYAHPGGLRNSAGRLAGYDDELPDVDLRADGGALVAPPSMHVSGRRYRWVNPTVPLAPAPAWLRDPPHRAVLPPDRLGPGSTTGYGRAALQGELTKLLQVEGGGRNHALNRAAFFLGMLVGGGELAEDLVHDELASAAQAIGLPVYESERTIASGLQEGMRRPRVAPHRQVR